MKALSTLRAVVSHRVSGGLQWFGRRVASLCGCVMVPRCYEEKILNQSTSTEEAAARLGVENPYRSGFYSGAAAALREISRDIREFK
jgi:hypothetical protein